MQPYFPISQHYKRLFGQKVHRIPVSIATDCPNRLGLKGMTTCIFCDEWGSAAYSEQESQSLQKQIEDLKTKLGDRYHAAVFLAYFQAYTSTFLSVTKLRESFDAALKFTDIKGLVVGTRPDCLSRAVLETWGEYSQKTYVAVELGVQSFFDDQLMFLRRGHTAQQSIDAISKIKAAVPKMNLGVHLIFGIPGETDKTIIQTAQIINTLPVDHVKLHNLHVLKNTPLADLYASGAFTPLDLETYTKRVILFLQYLRPDIAIQRTVAVASRWDELIAPEWTKFKMKNSQFILDQMTLNGAYQGQFFTKCEPTHLQAKPSLHRLGTETHWQNPADASPAR